MRFLTSGLLRAVACVSISVSVAILIWPDPLAPWPQFILPFSVMAMGWTAGYWFIWRWIAGNGKG